MQHRAATGTPSPAWRPLQAGPLLQRPGLGDVPGAVRFSLRCFPPAGRGQPAHGPVLGCRRSFHRTAQFARTWGCPLQPWFADSPTPGLRRPRAHSSLRVSQAGPHAHPQETRAPSRRRRGKRGSVGFPRGRALAKRADLTPPPPPRRCVACSPDAAPLRSGSERRIDFI